MDFDDLIARFLPLISILLGLGGVALTLVALNRYFNGQEVKNWPQAQGVITQSEVYRHEVKSSQTNMTNVSFGIRCSYNYKVEGAAYTGQNICYGENLLLHRDMKKAQAEAAKYPVGAKVAVYYNPKNPKNAALEPRVREGSVESSVMVGAIFIVVGVVLFFVSRSMG
jgi:hypothetical protein